MQKGYAYLIAQILLIVVFVFIIHSYVPIGYNNIVSNEPKLVKWYDEENTLHETTKVEIIETFFQGMNFKEVDTLDDETRLLCELIHKNYKTTIYLINQNQIGIRCKDHWYLSYKDETLLFELKRFSEENTE